MTRQATLEAGKLDRRITVQRQGEPYDDGYTTLPGELETYYECWADWQPIAGREIFENLGREAKSGGYLFIRDNAKASGIRPTDEVLWDGRVYGIAANDPHDRNAKRRLTVTAADST